ncbi:MAG: flagellar filament capping protein FliD [Candidatus Brocadiia bacterium]
MASTSGASPLSLTSQSSIYSTISTLMQAVDAPITAEQAKVTNLQNLNTVYDTVESDLSALGSAATAMTNAVTQPLSARTVSSSDPSIVTATATSSAALGAHSIAVSQLAEKDTLVSNRFTSDGTDIAGALGAGNQSFTITVNGQSQDVSVALTAGETDSAVLSAVASAINTAFASAGDDGVSATALADTSTTSKLVLQSNQTGQTYAMTLSDDSNGSSLLATLGVNATSAATDTTGGYIYAPSALDAEMTVDGVAVTRDSNIVSDVLPGVTLNLVGQQATGANPVNLTVSADTDSITTEVQNFVTNYNTVLSYLNSETAVSASTGASSALSDEPMYENLIGTLRSTVSAAVPDTGSPQVQTLADIGITQASDGTLSLDTGTLDQMLSTSPTAVASLFNATDGIANQVNTVLTPFTQTNGIMAAETNNANSQIASLNATIKQMNAAAAVKETQYVNEYSQLQALQSKTAEQQSYMQTILTMLADGTSTN